MRFVYLHLKSCFFYLLHPILPLLLMDSQKSHKSKNNAWRTKDLLAGLRTYKNRKTYSRQTPVQDGQFSFHQGSPFYRGLTVHAVNKTNTQLITEILAISLHKKWSFPLRISSVNVTKPAVSFVFGHIYWRNL